MMRPRSAPSGWRRPGVVAASLLALVIAGVCGSLRDGPGSALVALTRDAHAAEAAAEVPPPPAWLSETGLYRADGSVDPRNRPFTPQYPLWTDGADKSRWIRLPAGAVIDVADVDAWRFPAGTTVWKEFAWNGRRVETRMIRAEADGRWTFATYVWNDRQTDAELAPAEGLPGVYEIAAGRRHSIPSRSDCRSCHGSSPSRLLGFTALQLSDDRDPLAPHADPLRPGMLTLRTLVAEKRLSPPRPDLARRPPRVVAADPVERAARGYLSANCGHCHNARGPLASLGFSLLQGVGRDGEVAPSAASPIGAHTRFVVPGVPPDSTLAIAPGDPERSAVAYRLASRRPVSQMPPLGTVIVDSQAVDLVRLWIASMDHEPSVAAVPSPLARSNGTSTGR